MEIAFYVDGVPVAKPRMTQRDKFFRRRATAAYWAWSDLIKWTFKSHMAGDLGQLMAGTTIPWLLTCHFRFPIPPSWSKSKKALALKESLAHTVKPDLKNLVAGVEDSLNGLIWHDDSQIPAWGTSTKVWAATPGAAIVATTIEPREIYRLSRKYGIPAPIALVKEDRHEDMKG